MNVTELVDAIYTASTKAQKATHPVQFHMGTVVKDDPLEIQISEKIILTEASLILSELVFEREQEFVDPTSIRTESSTAHSHSVEMFPFTIKRKLEVGDKVLLLNDLGGQRFLVLTRLMEKEQ